jgi:hypothetical protein
MSPLTQLLVPSAILFVLVGVILLVVLRLRAAARENVAGRARMSEEAFAAMAMRDALTGRAASGSAAAAAATTATSGAAPSFDDV